VRTFWWTPLDLGAHLHPQLGVEGRQRLVRTGRLSGLRTMAPSQATRWRWPPTLPRLAFGNSLNVEDAGGIRTEWAISGAWIMA